MQNILPEFQEYLVGNKIVSEKNVSFYAYWVSKFLAFSNNNENLQLDSKIKAFLKSLKTKKDFEDWKIKQAALAIKLYITGFKKNSLKDIDPNIVIRNKNSFFNYNDAVKNMRNAMRLRHYAYKTEKSYIFWVEKFYNYIEKIKGKQIEYTELKSSDVKDFLSYLAVKQKVSASTQNQAFNALLFLFKNVFKITLVDLEDTVRAKRGLKLPVVLSVEEIKNLFKHIEGEDLLIVKILYGAGLRLMELARLRVKDIDFDFKTIMVRNSKGDKDRTTMLPENIKSDLKLHLEKVKNLHDKDLGSGYGDVYLPFALEKKYPNANKQWLWQYVFPSSKLSVDPRSGKVRRHHISEKTVQHIVREAAKKAGIVKHATVHTLRHSFATHLLMNGINIREIQELLGHKHIDTTMIYTHVLRNMSNMPVSPLDKMQQL